jgi:hypothetical protein
MAELLSLLRGATDIQQPEPKQSQPKRKKKEDTP